MGSEAVAEEVLNWHEERVNRLVLVPAAEVLPPAALHLVARGDELVLALPRDALDVAVNP
jgi:hypothetical protein